MLIFVIDEDMPRSTGKALKEQGYEVKDIRDHKLRGAEDEIIFRFAQKEKSVILTGDKDFGNILQFPLGNHFGIIVAHFPNEFSTKKINQQLISRLKELSENDFQGNLIIIESMKIRIKTKNEEIE